MNLRLKNLFWPSESRWNHLFVADIPSTIANRQIYLVGEKNIWCILFKCPCGCGELIQLNTLEDEDPLWSYQIKNGLTIRPSIRRIRGCKSHFLIIRGKVYFDRRI
jgi:hypothetical protein